MRSNVSSATTSEDGDYDPLASYPLESDGRMVLMRDIMPDVCLTYWTCYLAFWVAMELFR